MTSTSGEASTDPIFVVFNPRSGKGRGERLVQPVLEALRARGLDVAHARTEQAGDEGRLATDALARGHRRIVAVGGDGTWSNVANAVIRSGIDAAVGFVPAGTGCDLAKSLGIPAKDVGGCAEILRQGHTRRIDVGKVEGRYFLNVVGFGFDIAVIEDSWTVTYLGGDLLYLYCALRQLHRFPGFPVEMTVEAGTSERRDMLMLIIANGRIFGGGFQIAPTASLDDGLLDGVAFGNMPLVQRLPLMLQLLKGSHGRSPRVSTTRAARYRLRFDAPPAYETDGEWNRATSTEITVECVPRALRVMAPPA